MRIVRPFIALATYLLAAMWYYRGDFGRAWLFDLTFRTLGSEEVSKLIADHLVPITLVVIGSYLFWASIRPQLANHDFYRHLPTVDHLNPFNQTISLRDAANRLYDELRGTDIGESFDSHSAATSDEILDGVAHHIMEHVPLEVKRPPSIKWEPLPENEKGRLVVRGGATGLRYIGYNTVMYPEVRLKRKDLERLIRDYQARARPLRRPT